MYGMVPDAPTITAGTGPAKLPAKPAGFDPLELVKLAIASGNMDMVERMAALAERFRAQAALHAFSDAMSAAQGEMTAVSRDAANPQTRSRYATLGALDNAIRPIYTKHGFSVIFDTERAAPRGRVHVVATVAGHGHEKPLFLDMPVVTTGAQGKAVMTETHATISAISYARRQMLKMAFNLAEEDDDGNAAGGRPVNRSAPVAGSEVAEEDDGTVVTEQQEQTLKAALETREMPVNRLLKYVRANYRGPRQLAEDMTLADIPASLYEHLLSVIKEAQQ